VILDRRFGAETSRAHGHSPNEPYNRNKRDKIRTSGDFEPYQAESFGTVGKCEKSSIHGLWDGCTVENGGRGGDQAATSSGRKRSPRAPGVPWRDSGASGMWCAATSASWCWMSSRTVEDMLERVRRAQSSSLKLALSRRKQGFESPRERQYFQQLRGIKLWGLGAISNFSPMDVASEDRFEVTL
jgi:hypothetical protein